MKEIELGIVSLSFILFLMINYAFFTEILNRFFVFGVVAYFIFFEIMGLKKIKTSLKELIIFGLLLLYWFISFPFYVLLETFWGWTIFIIFPTIVYLAFYRKEKELYLFTIVLTILFSTVHFIVLGEIYANVHLFFIPVMFFLILLGLYYYFVNWPSEPIERVKPIKKKKERKKD